MVSILRGRGPPTWEELTDGKRRPLTDGSAQRRPLARTRSAPESGWIFARLTSADEFSARRPPQDRGGAARRDLDVAARPRAAGTSDRIAVSEDADLVFCSTTGKTIGHRSITARGLAKAAERAGLQSRRSPVAAQSTISPPVGATRRSDGAVECQVGIAPEAL
jgi:hypothetical protein